MKARLLSISPIICFALFCGPEGRAQAVVGVTVENPVADQAYLVTEPDKLDKVAELEDVFSGKDHQYGFSLTPEGIVTATLRDGGELDLHTDATAFGTVTVTITAQDAAGGIASDTFKVTLRPLQMYVDANSPAAPEDQDGATWNTAYRHLQDGLREVVVEQEIWVAGGVYYPDVDAAGDSGLRSASFVMRKEISMYGGFAGSEANRDERNPSINLSILSGDIDQDDFQGPIATHARTQAGDQNNSYRVVDMSDCKNKDTLDGFVITAGRADVGPDHLNGAGVFAEHDVRITNCWITGNYAVNGGGLYIQDDDAIVSICRLSGNVAEQAGGAVSGRKGGAMIFNCEIRGNRAAEGGALYLGDVDFELANCVISGNCGETGGGAIHMADGKLIAVNCTLVGNHSAGVGGGLKVVKAGGDPKFKNVIIWGNHGGGSTTSSVASIHVGPEGKLPKISNSLVANSGGSAGWNGSAGEDEGGNLDLDPLCVFPIVPSIRPSEYGIFSLRADSPALEVGIQKHLFQDEPDLDRDGERQELISIDLAGNARMVGAEVDLGAYEFDPLLLLDSDGDGLSDLFELTHTGDPVILEALSDQDVDSSTALGEYLHGTNPTSGTTVPAAQVGTVNYLGTEYLTLTFVLDPAALQFVTYRVERCGDVGTLEIWHDDRTVQIASGASLDFPGLLEVTHRSLAPLGQERREFLRLRHIVINPASS